MEKFTKVLFNEVDYLTDLITGVMAKEREDRYNDKDFKDIHCKRLRSIEGRVTELESIIDEMGDSIDRTDKDMLWGMIKDLEGYIDIAQSLIGDRKIREDINKRKV